MKFLLSLGWLIVQVQCSGSLIASSHPQEWNAWQFPFLSLDLAQSHELKGLLLASIFCPVTELRTPHSPFLSIALRMSSAYPSLSCRKWSHVPGVWLMIQTCKCCVQDTWQGLPGRTASWSITSSLSLLLSCGLRLSQPGPGAWGIYPRDRRLRRRLSH